VNNERTITLLLFSAFFGISESKAQGRLDTALYDPASPIVQIEFQDGERSDPRMGFVVGKNLVATATPDNMQGDYPIVRVSFATTSVATRHPIARFSASASVAAVDRSGRIALLAVNTADATPIVLASKLTDGEALYWYMEVTTPNKNELHGTNMIFTIVAAPKNGFRSFLGGPVLNVHGEAVGITNASCDESIGRENCIAPIQKLRQLISSVH
jgi:hypothetical protein